MMSFGEWVVVKKINILDYDGSIQVDYFLK